MCHDNAAVVSQSGLSSCKVAITPALFFISDLGLQRSYVDNDVFYEVLKKCRVLVIQL